MSTARLIVDGEPVRAGVANRPLGDLQRQIDDLRTLLNSLSAGRQLIISDVALSSDCVVGQPVSWDEGALNYRPALAVASQSSGYLRLDPLAKVIGVVRAKTGSLRGDLTIFGVDTIDLTASTGSVTPADGDYFLSAVTPGKLITGTPSVSIRVLSIFNGKIVVDPWRPDLLESHTHLKFDLFCKPAGTVTPPGSGVRHTIGSPDNTQTGWLPAGNSIFAGNAPAGAVWGYNLTKHPQLAAVWPPLDLASVDLVWDKGLSPIYSGMSVAQGHNGACIIDKNGLWWMSDCYQDVPWPYDYPATPPTDGDTPECPRNVYMSLKLYFTRLRFSTETSVVTSLRSLDTRLKVICASDTTKTATVGDLLLNLDFALSTLAGNTRGSLALKELTEDGKFTQGRVTEGIYATSDTILLTSDQTPIHLVDGDSSTPLVYQGLVGISAVPESLIELTAEFVRLNGAEDNIYQDIPYVSFPKGQASSIRVSFRVPASAIISATLKMKLRLFGPVAGTLPAMTATARRIPVNPTTPASVPGTGAEFSVTVNTAVTFTGTNQYVDIEATPFDVAAGDTVLFSIGRGASDSYNSNIGLLAISSQLVNS